MIQRVQVRVSIGTEIKEFESRDMDTVIADVDSYLAGKR